MTNIERAADIIEDHLARSEVARYAPNSVHMAFALADDGLLMPDPPEPKIDNDGWAKWYSEYVTEAEYHSEKGLWTYDDGRMVQDSPERLREVAYIYLAAADYAERNQA